MHRGIAVQSSGIYREIQQEVRTGYRHSDSHSVEFREEAPRRAEQANASRVAHDLCLQKRIECELGESLTFTLPFKGTVQYALASKPEGSAVVFSGNRMAGPDKPGVYTVVCECEGGWARVVDVCAYHPNQVYGQEKAPEERQVKRLAFRSWVNDPARSVEDCRARLESKEALAPIAQKRAEVNVPDHQVFPVVPAKRAKALDAGA